MRDYELIGSKMNELEKQKKYDERNTLVPLWREAYYSHDFGFEVGEEVEYFSSPHRKQIGKILEIRPDQQVVFKNVIVPITWLTKIHEQQEKLQEKYEQLKLHFNIEY
ncbi:MAG: hypothetical protein ACQEWW_26445 [Bacillota bacterium]